MQQNVTFHFRAMVAAFMVLASNGVWSSPSEAYPIYAQQGYETLEKQLAASFVLTVT